MAIKTQGTLVYMESALATGKAISAIAVSSPGDIIRVTATGHGYTEGDIVKISGVSGMEEVNNRAFVVDDIGSPANTFELKGCKGTYYNAYVSGGYAYKATLTAVGEVRDLPDLGGTEANEFDVSHLLSVVEQKLSGLPRQAPVSFNLWFSPGTARHIDLARANEDLQDRVFRFYKSGTGGFNLTLVAQVSGFKVSGGDVNSAFSAAVTLTPRAAGAWADLT
jgi:hypothetical protein